jgi:putative transposase
LKKLRPYRSCPALTPFIERLIGTIRREYLDPVLFWNRLDLQRKLGQFARYYDQLRVHSALAGKTPAERGGRPSPQTADLRQFSWQAHCHGLFHTPLAA